MIEGAPVLGNMVTMFIIVIMVIMVIMAIMVIRVIIGDALATLCKEKTIQKGTNAQNIKTYENFRQNQYLPLLIK